MKLTKKYKVLWVVLIIIIGLNIWLLYGKINLQQQMNNLQAQTLQKEASVAQLAEPVLFSGEFKRPVGLVAIFTDYGCTSCVIAEIEYLNEWDQKFSGTLQVYYLGSSKRYLEDLGAEFLYQNIESANNLFSVGLSIGNPIIAVIDENNTVQAIHTNDLSRLGSNQRRAHFYRRAESLFTAVY